ncbi:MAG: GspE/PulE family protein [Spirochaetia bacterium]
MGERHNGSGNAERTAGHGRYGGANAGHSQYASEFMRANRVVRLPDAQGRVSVGMVDPDDTLVRDQLECYHGGGIHVLAISESELVKRLSTLVAERYDDERLGGLAAGEALSAPINETPSAVDALSPAVPAVRFVNALFYDAVEARASDVHVEARASESRIRYRIDGMLHTVRTYAAVDFSRVVSRLKVMSRVTATERRLPQDGRFSFEAGGRSYDVRTSFVPCHGGESVAIRLLDTAADTRGLRELGLRDEQATILEHISPGSGGLIMISGPTGSGKTTTVHALLRRYCDGRRKILAIEDPVEYRIPGVVQVQIRREIGLDFDGALRRALRHDPDILMVGEIRDSETATLAVRSALSGHLVFSTVHTEHIDGITARLENLGVPQYLLEEVMAARVSQRLMRRVCAECAAVRVASPAERERAHRAGVALHTVREGAGCPRCHRTGYRGRLGVFEVSRSRHSRGDRLPAQAWTAVARGETTPGEVSRAVAEAPARGRG